MKSHEQDKPIGSEVAIVREAAMFGFGRKSSRGRSSSGASASEDAVPIMANAENEPYVYQERMAITFEAKPMGIDLETKPFFGGLKKGVAVKSFARGKPREGRLAIGDVLVSVNGVPCTGCSFADTMKMLKSAQFPVTLQFEMKSSGSMKQSAASEASDGVAVELDEVGRSQLHNGPPGALQGGAGGGDAAAGGSSASSDFAVL